MASVKDFRSRLAHGLCTRCGHQKVIVGYLCDGCRDTELARQAELARARRTRRKAAGLCVTCNAPVEDGKSRNCEKCKRRSRKFSAQWRKRNPIDGERLEKKRLSDRERGARWRAEIKALVIAEYGGKCTCCGETEPIFLTIDHINNDGHKMRKIETTQLYAYLKRHGFPKDNYQLLCFNCNLGKHYNGGTCPHKKGL